MDPLFPQAPTLETSRLILRAHGIGDLEASIALWSHPVVGAHIMRRPSTPEETWWRILRYAGLWPLLGFGYWAVVEKSSGRFIGDVGFADFKRDMTPSLEGLPEIGWVLDPAIHGQGYATEAVRAALSWMGRTKLAPATVCIISPDNHASLRVAQKSGYEEIARTFYSGNEVIMLRRDGGRNA